MNKKERKHAAAVARQLIRAQARESAAHKRVMCLQKKLDAIAQDVSFGEDVITDKSETGKTWTTRAYSVFGDVLIYRQNKHTPEKQVKATPAHTVPAKDRVTYGAAWSA